MGFIASAIKARRVIWTYGICNGRHARRNTISGNVQFVLWSAGEQGHMVEYWHPMDSSWSGSFVKYKGEEINHASRH